MSTIIKQQPCSPTPYHSFPNNFYHHHHHHHRQSIASSENEQLSPTGDNIAENASTSNFIPPQTVTDGGGRKVGGWYEEKFIQILFFSI
jgi:hypothetical protein